MIPEIGSFAIILALLLSMIQSVVPRVRLTAAIGQFCFLALAMICLILSFLQNDITVIYVREHSNALLPMMYQIGAAWGGHEGSLLLWCLILSAWTTAFIVFSQIIQKSLLWENGRGERIVMILGFLSAGFISFLFFTSNPFLRDFPTDLVTGNELTPILQDPGLIFHPPMLYLGYVGFAIGFAFAITALLEGKLDEKWASACRPWVVLPWSFLACGIVLGSWWAYRELGWGGWWFWDPVENASLLPWLAATAFLHSLIVSEKRNVFKGWTLLLAILTFTLCLLGTFLVRSGVLVSVHTFANDPTRGIFLLGYLAIIVSSALLLYSCRIKHFYSAHHFDLFSRETLLLINSVFLLTAVATIVIGTLYPIILEAFDLGKISVGEPYFNTVFIPLMLPLLFLMGTAPHVNWGQQPYTALWKKLRFSLLLSSIIGFSSPLFFGFPFYFLTAIGITIGLWIIIATLQFTFTLWRTHSLALKHGAMIIAHLGIAILVLGIVINKSYSTERQVKMAIGESVNLAGYQFTFKSIGKQSGPNYESMLATFSINNQHTEHTVTVEQRIYSYQQVLSKTGILVNPWRDLYLALGTPLPGNSWSVRLYYKPFVRWIWCGGFLLLIGGMLSLLTTLQKWRQSHVQ